MEKSQKTLAEAFAMRLDIDEPWDG